MQRMLVFMGCMLGGLPCVQAQVVQLPSFHQFSVETTVSVPDSGGAFLAGVKRSYLGSSERGALGRNRASGSATGSGGISVHATIIDHEALDERVLAAAKSKRSFVLAPLDVTEVAPASLEPKRVASLSSIRQELAAEDARQEAAAEVVFQKALACEAKMEWRLARTYYQLAAQKSPALVKAKAQERLAALRSKLPAQK